MKKASTGSIMKFILVIIVFVFIILILFNLIKASSYSGRFSAKLAYSLSGAASFIVDKSTAATNTVSTVGEYVFLSTAGLLATVGAIKGYKTYVQLNKIAKGEAIADKIVVADQEWIIKKSIQEGAKASYQLLSKKPVYMSLIAGAGLWIGGNVFSAMLNNLASSIQDPILYYLVPNEVYIIDMSQLEKKDIDAMLREINEDYRRYIKNNVCDPNNPASPECQNLYLTYLIAKSYYFTYGETLGQSVTTTKNHVHYTIIYDNYDAGKSDINKKAIRTSSVLCMLYMMEFKGLNPYNKMFSSKDAIFYQGKPLDNTLSCEILYNVLKTKGRNANTDNVKDVEDEINRRLVIATAIASGDDIKELPDNKGKSIIESYIIKPEGGRYKGIIYVIYSGGANVIYISSIYQKK